MWMKSRRSWELEEREATPAAIFLDRRRAIAAVGIGALGAALGAPGSRSFAQEKLPRTGATTSDAVPSVPPSSGAPVRNPHYTLDRALTDETVAARSNIFDEFGSERDRIWEIAAGFRTHPWRIHIGGKVSKALTLDVDELVRRAGGPEERLYRHRCVETWAMAVPWLGIPMRRLVEIAEPAAAARFVRVITAARPDEMPGWYATKRVFPYYEALTIEEATNELAFLATGIYGHPLPPQHGAPIRLVVPWKYGFKSAKSLVAFQFTTERPTTFWSELQPERYDFWSNVDPTSTKPWPQNDETMLGTGEKRATLPFNGYGDLVAGLYG
jgi:sulfoxide reductase catalytic subunit YedY